MSRDELTAALEDIYRKGSVWGEPSLADDGTVHVIDCLGIEWIALAIVPEDLDDPAFPERLVELANRPMPGTDRCCVFEVYPAEECRPAVRVLLRELRLNERVSVYSRVSPSELAGSALPTAR
ncbi:MAG: hypothetical protein IT201_07875 [Thermoleophilia bacterium]|nr:hypothetical protein [Thermoleophilia bacterium]